MKRYGIIFATILLSLAMLAPAMAQDPNQPPPPQEDGQPGGPPPQQGRFGGGPGGGPGEGPGGRMGRPGGRGSPGQPAGPRGGGAGQPGGAQNFEMQKVEALRAYLDTVDRFTKLANDPSASAVAAVLSLTDLLRPRGPAGAIDVLAATLADSKSPAVRRALRIQIADLYKQSGQPEKAMEMYQALIKEAP